MLPKLNRCVCVCVCVLRREIVFDNPINECLIIQVKTNLFAFFSRIRHECDT